MTEELEKPKSLGKRLLRVVFGTYFFVALGVTLGQLYSEYKNVNHRIDSTIQELFDISEKGIAASMWDMDQRQIETAIQGIAALKQIEGVRILDYKDRPYAAQGNIPEEGKGSADSQQLLEYSFTLSNQPEGEEASVVGTMFIYTRADIVLEEVKFSFLLIFANSIVKTLALWIIFLIAINTLVQRPLDALRRVCMDFNPENPVRSGNLDQLAAISKRKDELGFLGRHFGLLIDTVSTYMEKLRAFTKNLESLVQQRTMQLEERNSNIEAIMDNMDLGVMTVDQQGVIQEPCSRSLSEITGFTDPIGRSINEVLLAHSDLSPDQKSTIQSVIFGSIDSDPISFQMNVPNLPISLILTKGSEYQELHIGWQAITVQGTISRLLITVRDVTELKRRQKRAEADSKDAQILAEILNQKASQVRSALKRAGAILDDICSAILQSKQIPATDDHNHILLELHTLKGNFRLMHFSHLVHPIHFAEEYFVQCKAKPEDWKVSEAYERLDTVRVVLAQYQDLLSQKILNFAEEILNISNDPTRLDQSQKSQQDGEQPLDQVLHLLKVEAGPMAAKAESPVPQIVQNGNIMVPDSLAEAIHNICSHAVANSIAHGTPEVDDDQSPVSPMKIFIVAETTGHHIHLCIFDDGQGINLSKLRHRATANKLSENASDHEVAQWVFLPGLTTAQEVTEMAGRGVGMSAIKKIAEEHGGTAEIELTSHSTPGKNLHRRAFALRVTLSRPIATTSARAS